MTCRNRAVGRSFACSLCGKSFPTKRHLNEHGKRKHPTIVVSQQQQQQQQPVVPALTTATTTSTVATTVQQATSGEFSSALKCEPMTPSLPSMKPALPVMASMSKPAYIHSNHSGVFMNQPLQDHSSQMLQCPPIQNYGLASNPQPAMFQHDLVNNGCYAYGNVKSEMMTSQQLQQQQQHQLSHINNNNNSHFNTDEENVGSLLRLVYSCPDPMLEHESANFVDQEHFYNHGGQICSQKPSDQLMEFPMLDGIPLEYL